MNSRWLHGRRHVADPRNGSNKFVEMGIPQFQRHGWRRGGRGLHVSEPVGVRSVCSSRPTPTGQKEDYTHCEWGNLL